MNGPELITLGCRLNIAESEALSLGLAGRDDVVIVNSCAVTNEAVRQARQTVRKARRNRPDAHIVVTGCAAQVHPDMFAAMPEVDAVRGNAEKAEHALFMPDSEARSLVSDIMAVRDTAPHLAASFSERARAFVEVQNGCDHRCTFCIIPYGRGNSRSVPAGQLVANIRDLVERGMAEVVLTGVDLTSYGHDLPGKPHLGRLVEQILTHVPELARLRLSSLDGIEIDDRLFDLLTGEERIMPHVHLSLQAGDDMVLKRMKRRHSRAQAVELCQRLRDTRPDIAIGADIIAGFPTESDAMFENTLAMVAECSIVHGHVFPFSPREGTPAAHMPQVPPPVRKERAARLREAVQLQRTRWLGSLVGSRQAVLFESAGRGHAPNFAPVEILGTAPEGKISMVEILSADEQTLQGRLI